MSKVLNFQTVEHNGNTFGTAIYGRVVSRKKDEKIEVFMNTSLTPFIRISV